MHGLVGTAMTGKQAPGTDTRPRYSGVLSVSRSLQVVAAVLLLLIVGVTAHQLATLRASIVADTAQQMSRLDMVFAEQTGRAVETVDFILRNAIETLLTQRATHPPDADTFDALLGRRAEGVRQLIEVMITDVSGHVLYSSHRGADMLPA
jgi:hypothetical protein